MAGEQVPPSTFGAFPRGDDTGVVWVKYKGQVKPWLGSEGKILSEDLTAIMKVLFGVNPFFNDGSFDQKIPQSSRDAFYEPQSIGYGQGVRRKRRTWRIVPLRPNPDNPDTTSRVVAPVPSFEIIEDAPTI